ncbi:hypothetical protein GGI20_000909 [Coemansia sp. BCRC 34301]|nr:hypothetical protein GGI20_000909 [Coemansia sp. BCRC 34301]
MSRGRGRGDGTRREISALQTELLGKSLFSKNGEKSNGFPDYDIGAGRTTTKEEMHVADLMEKFRAEMQSSVFFLQAPAPARDVERYSDRYFKAATRQSLKGIKTNLSLFPEELHQELVKKSTKRAKTVGAVDSGDGLIDALKGAKDEDDDEDGAGGTKSGGSDVEKTDKEGDDDDEEELDGSEDEEEGNDYLDSYFDNGEEDDMGDIDDDDGGGGDY